MTTHSTPDPTEPTPSQRPVPTRIGSYLILESIGEGGMGEVYLAEQRAPVRRRVAVKIVKWGMDTQQVIARFEAERQALAMMSHPNIARIYDAGSTESGRPYFVMEFVPGEPISTYCDRHRLSTRERLELFVPICEAIHHAHQKGVIHRDIKPSNVLVTIVDGKPTPKVIDFGVAKATQHSLTHKTIHTQHGQLIGTPAYMSPEQAEMSGLNIDTTTDVYSLGALLYELLTGRPPFDIKELRSLAWDQVHRIIRETDPPRPSTRISALDQPSVIAVTRDRSTSLGPLTRDLRHELDWITMRAMEKDRTRRYQSALELAADVGRRLRNEPVHARPPSVVYRGRKFVLRHTVGVSAIVAAVFALAAFAGVMASQAQRIAQERDRAERAQLDLEAVVEFQADMLSTMDLALMGMRTLDDIRARVVATDTANADSLSSAFNLLTGSVNATDIAVRMVDTEILAKAVSALDQRFGTQPLIDAQLRQTIGSTYLDLTLQNQAAPLLQQAYEIRLRELGPDDIMTYESIANLGLLAYFQEDFARAEELLGRAREKIVAEYGPDDQAVLRIDHALCGIVATLGDNREAVVLAEELMQACVRVHGKEHEDTIRAMSLLAGCYKSDGRLDDAQRLEIESLELSTRVLGPEHALTISSKYELATIYLQQSRFDEAEPLLREVLQLRRHLLGTHNQHTLATLGSLVDMLLFLNRIEEAEPLLVEFYEAHCRLWGPDHSSTLGALLSMANLRMSQGQFAVADSMLTVYLEAATRLFGRDHPGTLDAVGDLARLKFYTGDYEKAETLYREVWEAQARVFGPEHPQTLRTRFNLVSLYSFWKRYLEAERMNIELLEVLRRALGVEHVFTQASLYNLACLKALRGASGEAMGHLRECVEAGYTEWVYMSDDPDLASLHGDEFDELVAVARANAEG